MILLREIQEKDIESLERLAQIPGFINLQNDRDFLNEKIQRSLASFRAPVSPSGERHDASKYVFVAEDLDSGVVVGTSMIAGQHGTEDEPHFYFEVGSEEKFSKSIGTGFIHGTLKLRYDTNGPSEIGGLVMDPQFRNSDARLGRQISFVRFLYVAMNRERFKKNILAELLPPLNKKGQSPLWEAIGRRFTNMDYWEADRLCQQDKEFIFSLFPTGKIYTTFLPAEAKNAIGKVGKDTEPVLHMLNKIGFRYRNQVDPFDGGPHLWAKRDELLPVRNSRRVKVEAVVGSASSAQLDAGLVAAAVQEPGAFRAVHVHAVANGGTVQVFFPDTGRMERFVRATGIRSGSEAVFMPYY
jgi:arginine N-succinyltransferase